MVVQVKKWVWYLGLLLVGQYLFGNGDVGGAPPDMMRSAAL